MKKGTKIAAIVLSCLFLLLVAAAFILPYLIRLDRYKGMIEARVGEALERKVSLKGLRITILPTLGAKIDDLVISNPSEFSPTPFLSIQALQVRVKLLPLLVGRKEVAGLTLQEPKVFVERDKRGRLNIPLMEEKIRKTRRGSLKTGRVKGAESKALRGLYLSRASIEGGDFVYLDRSTTPARRIEIEAIDLNLKDLSLEKKVKYHVSLKWAPGDVSVEGWLGPLGETTDLKRIPLEGVVRVEFPRLEYLMKELAQGKGPAIQGGLKGDLNFQGNIGSSLKVHGAIFLNAFSLGEKTDRLIYDLDLTLRPEAVLSWEKEELTLTSNVQIEETPFQIEGGFSNLQRKPSGKLTFSSAKGIVLEQWSPKFPPLQKAVNLKGKLSLKGDLRIPHDGIPSLFLEADSSQMEISLVKKEKKKEQGTSQERETKEGERVREPSRLDVKGRFRVKDGKFQGVGFHDLFLAGEMRGDELAIERFSLTVLGGKLEGSGGFNRAKSPAPFHMKTHMTEIDVNAVLNNLTSWKGMIKGRLDGRMSLQGTGLSLASLKRDLTGSGRLQIREGELSWLNIVAQIVRAMGGKGWGREKTTFDNLAFSFAVQRGKLSLPDVLLSHKDMEMRMWGDMDLNLKLQMEGEAHLPPSATKDLSEKGWRYFKDKKGRLTIPFSLKGNLKDPEVRISARLIEKGIEGVLEEFLRKKIP